MAPILALAFLLHAGWSPLEGPGPGLRVPNTSYKILLDVAVQQRLGLDSSLVSVVEPMVKDHEQVSRVIALAHEVWERFGLAAAERYDDEVIDYLIGRIRELDESTEASLRVYLNHDQLHRFRRIRLGAMGCDAFLFPEIEQALGLSDDQRIKIREAMRETGRREAVEWLKANRDPFGPEPEVLANLRWEERRRIASVLTQGQLAWWREIAEVPTEAELFGRRLGYSVLKNLREWRASLPPVAHSPQVPSRSLPTPGKTQASQ